MSAASEHRVIPINPALLRWARESVGLSLAEAAARAKIDYLKQKNLDPADRLRLIEEGKLPINENILRHISNAYRLPEIVFFLSAPPQEDKSLIDFRTVGSNAPGIDTPEFAALKRRALNLHDALHDIALENGDEPVSFINSVSLPISGDALAAKIEEAFGPNPRETVRGTDGKQLFNALRDQAQERGVYICLMGDLGHHTSKVDADEFRGMVISDPIAPLVIINPNDTDKANVFSLVHEFAHLLLGVTGVSDAGDSRHSKETERICNAAAAEYLLPAEACKKMLCLGADENDIRKMARHFKVSETATARRALDLGMIPSEMYHMIAQRAAAATKKSLSGKPDLNVVVKSRIGRKITQTMFDAAMNGIISFGTAASLLGLSISRLEKVCS